MSNPAKSRAECSHHQCDVNLVGGLIMLVIVSRLMRTSMLSAAAFLSRSYFRGWSISGFLNPAHAETRHAMNADRSGVRSNHIRSGPKKSTSRANDATDAQTFRVAGDRMTHVRDDIYGLGVPEGLITSTISPRKPAAVTPAAYGR
jgi:hypothetical protein